MKFKCTKKHCKHEGHFDNIGHEEYPLCPVCESPMLNMEKIVEDDSINKMLKNINHYGIDGTFKAIDRNIRNPLQRIAYRKILQNTIKKWNLKEG